MTSASSWQERELELQKEQRRQEENDKLRQEFAQHANAFHQWIQETRCRLHGEAPPVQAPGLQGWAAGAGRALGGRPQRSVRCVGLGAPS